MEFESVARELYGMPPEEFTSARNDRVKQARAEGDRGLAKRLQSLKRPTLAAWLVNELTRRHADEMAVLLDLGREMREGMSYLDGDELRILTQRRYKLVAALVQRARSRAADGGHVLRDEVAAAVQATLEATLSDPASANAVASGCLTEALQAASFGFPSAPGESDVARLGRPSPAEGASEVADLDAHRQRRAEEARRAEVDVASAEKRVAEARAHAEEVRARAATADEDRQQAAAAVQRLTDEIGRARARLDTRTAALDDVRREGSDADAGLRKAERALAEASERLRRVKR